MEAAVILAKCNKNRRTYGVRVQKMDDQDWWRTWAFEIDDSRASREGFDTTKIVGNLYATNEYPGCPYCGEKTLFYCNCGRISCSCAVGDTHTCPWCGNTCTCAPLQTKMTLEDSGDI